MPQRYVVVAVTAVAALWMYIDRVCFSTLADPAQKDLGMTDEQKEWMLSGFFLTYALFQIPVGNLADRYGQRRVLALSIVAWSVVTALSGFVTGAITLVLARLLLGVTEAGAYPAAAGLVKSWAWPSERGRFSSFVALGGRIGGAVAPALTAGLAVALAGVALTGTWDNPSGVNWRGVLVIYGLCGLAVAALFWLIIRDRPPAPPGAPDDPGVARPVATVAPVTFVRRLGILARSRNMWLSGGAQLGVNVGWALLITLLPSYLNQTFGVPLEERGRMQSVVLAVGCCGMLLGGVVTDALHRRLGPRLGRSVPIGTALAGCAACMFLVPALPTPWAVVAALGVMAFLVDLHNPSVWSFAQDVGGKNVGAALGWGNMWGNLGATASPPLLGNVARAAGWDAAFYLCGGLFVAAAVCGFLLDATKPVEEEG
ncbi:MAG TPA: MFS transporter [Urbifossiella sp.]|nr:MFS transporter [Urbifossiella sp.]